MCHHNGIRRCYSLTLISLVEMRSYLYDTSSVQYKNINKVAAGWREIARELEVSVKNFFACVSVRTLSVAC